MTMSKQVQRESTNLVLKSFPREKASRSDIAIIDLRSCIRDAMANAIRGSSDRRIFTASSADSLEKTAFCSNPSPQQFILFCDGSLDTDTVECELTKLRLSKPEAKVALLTDRDVNEKTPDMLNELDGVIPSFYETEQVLACISVIESGVRYLPAHNLTANTLRNGHKTAIQSVIIPKI
jgi:DNA-binding NarL/FixJ family response regulator